MYQFNFTGITTSSNTVSVSIQVNGAAVAWMYSYASQTYGNISGSVATYMNAGDSANVYINDGIVYGSGDGGSPRFSGFLIG
jgi:hypothetical protein